MFSHPFRIPVRLVLLVFINVSSDRSREVENTVERKLLAQTTEHCPCLKCCWGWKCFVAAALYLVVSFLLQLLQPGFICLSDVSRLFCVTSCFHRCCCLFSYLSHLLLILSKLAWCNSTKLVVLGKWLFQKSSGFCNKTQNMLWYEFFWLLR